MTSGATSQDIAALNRQVSALIDRCAELEKERDGFRDGLEDYAGRSFAAEEEVAGYRTALEAIAAGMDGNYTQSVGIAREALGMTGDGDQ